MERNHIKPRVHSNPCCHLNNSSRSVAPWCLVLMEALGIITVLPSILGLVFRIYDSTHLLQFQMEKLVEAERLCCDARLRPGDYLDFRQDLYHLQLSVAEIRSILLIKDVNDIRTRSFVKHLLLPSSRDRISDVIHITRRIKDTLAVNPRLRYDRESSPRTEDTRKDLIEEARLLISYYNYAWIVGAWYIAVLFSRVETS